MSTEIRTDKEFIYPNHGGHTGISISAWELDLNIYWGEIRVWVLEARFFVMGYWLKRDLVVNEEEKAIDELIEKYKSEWIPLMDQITAKETELWKEPNRNRLKAKEIIDAETLNKLGSDWKPK